MTPIPCIHEAHGERWSLYHSDCVEASSALPDASVGFSVYSPPFAKLYIYSESVADMGNCDDNEQFLTQYKFLARQLFRITKPGRLCAVHCTDVPQSKAMTGEISIKDLPGDLIRAHEAAGWIYHTRVTIWKDPVTEMQRSKALGLLHKTIKKDSSMSRMGIPDYLVVFRKPGVNADPISHTADEFPVSQWQEWASPVWMTVNQTRVLNRMGAKETNDEKHVCPLQLDTIERALTMWSNPGDVIFTPFAGIGSELYCALRMGRKAIGTELKESYWKQAKGFCEQAEREASTLFDAAMA